MNSKEVQHREDLTNKKAPISCQWGGSKKDLNRDGRVYTVLGMIVPRLLLNLGTGTYLAAPPCPPVKACTSAPRKVRGIIAEDLSLKAYVDLGVSPIGSLITKRERRVAYPR